MRQSIDPKYIAEGSAERCAERGHVCGGIMCGCDCHDSPAALAEHARTKARLDYESGASIEIKLADLSRVALEPGDALLLRCNDKLTQAQAGLIKLRLTQAFPGREIVMISGHAEVSVVRPSSVDGGVAVDRLELSHGAFALHNRDGVVGPDGQPALYVVCSCGRGYSFGHYADSERLLAWLRDHDAEIPCPHRPGMQVDGRCADCGEPNAAH